MIPHPPTPTLFPYTTLFRSDGVRSLAFKPGVEETEIVRFLGVLQQSRNLQADAADDLLTLLWAQDFQFISYTFRERSEEHTSELQSLRHLVCRLLLEKKKQV